MAKRAKNHHKSSGRYLLLLACVVAIAVPVTRHYVKSHHYLGLLNGGVLLESVDRYHRDLFRDTRILLTAYSEQGAMGVVINTPLPEALSRYPEKPAVNPLDEYEHTQVYWGGPVELTTPYSLLLDPGGSTFTMIAPKASLPIIYFGYSGWAAGQLEQEIRRGRWRVSTLNAEQLLGLLRPPQA